MTQPLKVNFSKNEADSVAREIPPTGEYTVAITDGSLGEVKPGKKNAGKPYWKLTLVIQSGPYSGTTLMSSVMLFNEALYSLSQLLKALGYNVNSGDFEVPALSDIVGKIVNVRGVKMPPREVDGQQLSERFEIKGYKKASMSSSNQVGAASSILP